MLAFASGKRLTWVFASVIMVFTDLQVSQTAA
jgi:hypothetical protein